MLYQLYQAYVTRSNFEPKRKNKGIKKGILFLKYPYEHQKSIE